MPSKELIEKVAFIVRHDGNSSPEITAEDILKTILAVLQEPTEGMLDAKAPWPDHWGDYDKASPMQRSAYQVDRLVARSSWRAMLNASPLGEKSE